MEKFPHLLIIMYRLVIATPLYPPEIGGPATYAKLLAEGLSERGIEVEVVKFSEVRHLPRLLRHYAFERRVRRALSGAHAALALDPVSVGLPTMRAARKARKPFIVKIVGDYAWEQGQQRFGVMQDLDEFVKTRQSSLQVRALQSVQTRVAHAARRVLVPSEYLKGIVAAWGIPSEKIEVIYNAVPAEEFGVVPEAVANLPRPLVVTAGRLVSWKHVDGIIDAVSRMPEVALAIIGDGPERAALAQRALEKLPGRAVLTGTLPHKDTLAAIRFADVFVLNSSYEGLSHLLIEALEAGVPIVATRAGGNTEVVEDGITGLLIQAGDTEDLTRALARVIADGAFRERFAAQMRESAKRFSTETMLAATAKLLHTL